MSPRFLKTAQLIVCIALIALIFVCIFGLTHSPFYVLLFPAIYNFWVYSFHKTASPYEYDRLFLWFNGSAATVYLLSAFFGFEDDYTDLAYTAGAFHVVLFTALWFLRNPKPEES